MRTDLLLATVTVLLGGAGTWLLLPHRLGRTRPRRVHGFGALMSILAVVLLSVFWTPPGAFLVNAFFYAFATAAICAGILMVTSRSPVHSALWFAAVVLSTSGLFLLAGAPFLAAGTVIVYAGAIIVTFLFVIMLAQSEGLAPYDRMARSPVWASLTCFLLFWGLLVALLTVRDPRGDARGPSPDRLPRAATLYGPPTGRPRGVNDAGLAAGSGAFEVAARAVSETARLSDVPRSHVAGLGGSLFTDHLIAVEVAGAILFVALVGAAAIAMPRPPVRPGARQPVGSDPAQERATAVAAGS